ncbi:hypothetical protein V491_06121, partial [Pseudogymnoascus sp. VKM F-3775]
PVSSGYVVTPSTLMTAPYLSQTTRQLLLLIYIPSVVDNMMTARSILLNQDKGCTNTHLGSGYLNTTDLPSLYFAQRPSNSSANVGFDVSEDVSIAGNRNSEEPHGGRSVDGMAFPTEHDDVVTGLMDQHQPSMPMEAYSRPVSRPSLQPPPLPPLLDFIESGAANTSITSSLWIRNAHIEEGVKGHLKKGQDDTVIFGALYRKDLLTLLPDAQNILSEAIINGYLRCLTNPRRENDIHGKVAMIGTQDEPGLEKYLADSSAIFIPIKLDTHWILAVLYPRSKRSEVYDSRNATNITTTPNVSGLLKRRLGDEYTPANWTAREGKCSLLYGNDTDSGLYALANAKCIMFNLEMIDLTSDEERLSFRWQLASEILKRSIWNRFKNIPRTKRDRL